MPFPDTDRVIYNKNPLDQVICQVRYPAILRIGSEIPAKFQDDIRAIFPLFQELQRIEHQNLPPEIAGILGVSGRSYEFSSEDKIWSVTLTRDFMSLTCKHYERWELFQEKLKIALEALIKEYQPAFFSRIGLRYQDVIIKSKLGLKEYKWSELLQPYIAGELGSPPVVDRIKEIMKQIIIDIPDELGKIRVIHGFRSQKSGEIGYLIDSDFFTDNKTEVNNVWGILRKFNVCARKLLKWCIQDRLHSAMEPSPLNN